MNTVKDLTRVPAAVLLIAVFLVTNRWHTQKQIAYVNEDVKETN